MTPELFLSRDGELCDIQEEFSEYVRYMLRSLIQLFIVQFLSMSLFLNLHFESDPYSNEYLIANIGFDTADKDRSKFGSENGCQGNEQSSSGDE